ncbi:MAG: DNA-directed polymerase [Clostridiales bacterium]|jgi:DNA polymerase-4|nr:DNA-directed polymerase [Clostridiales bacterium]
MDNSKNIVIGGTMSKPIIFHIDVNSAFLSWEACYRVNILGESADLRDIPSVVGGDQEKRHGIVLAKSNSAKKYKIQTGEPLVSALNKCPNLTIVPPNYELYVTSSRALLKILKEFSPLVEQYSIDEAYCDMTGTENIYGTPIAAATYIKDKIYEELGFTVNIGCSSNKLLAKMAGDFQKPNMVHSLFPEEIPDKMWPLDVGDLFFVGRATQKKLRSLGIQTIGELAHTDINILRYHFKKHGEVIYNYANGYDFTPLIDITPQNKGYGNSITIPIDASTASSAKMVLLSLCETVSTRLRADNIKASCISVSITDCEFSHASHQRNITASTNITNEIYTIACLLFDELWDKKTPIRQLGVHTSKLSNDDYRQYNLFDMYKYDKLKKLDSAIDEIRGRYGEDSVKRACFLDGSTNHMSGGIDKAKRTGITKGVE